VPGHRTLRLADVASQPDPDTGADWLPLRHELGVRAFGFNGWRAREPGMQVIEEHDESDTGHEEVYVVVAGRVRFTVDGEEVDAPAGTVLFVGDPAVRRVGVAEESGSLVLTVGAKPGEPFTVSEWEQGWLRRA